MQAMNWEPRKAPLDSPFSTHRKPALESDRTIEKREIYNFDVEDTQWCPLGLQLLLLLADINQYYAKSINNF